MITEKQYLEAVDIIKMYKKQESDYKSSVKKNIDNKVFKHHLENEKIWDLDISIRLLNSLNKMGLNYDSTLKEISQKCTRKQFRRIPNAGRKTFKELEKLLLSANLEFI